MAGRNSVVLKGDFVRKEGKATVAVVPGMLVQWDTDAKTIKPNVGIAGAVPGGAARKAFALENDLVGQGLGSTLLASAATALRGLGYRDLASTFLVGNERSALWHWRNGFRLIPDVPFARPATTSPAGTRRGLGALDAS